MNKTSNKPFAIAAALLIGLSACGSSTDSSSGGGYGATVTQPASASTQPGATQPGATQPVAASEPVAATGAGGAAVTVSDNALGKIMTDAAGLTLYGFTNDSPGTSTCEGGCASAWPPVIVDASIDLNKLPASGSFSIIDRADGTKQLQAGKFPLYRFAGDTAAGETNGQGSGGSWFVLAPDATMIK